MNSMGMINFYIVFGLALTLSIFALFAALTALVLVLAQRWSTHKIEWKPLTVNDPLASIEEEIEEDDRKDQSLHMEAIRLSREAAKKKKETKIEDPLDSIAESANFK